MRYVMGIGAIIGLAGAAALFSLGAVNIARAIDGDVESPELNATYGAIFVVAAIAVLIVSAMAAWSAYRLRRRVA